MTSILLINNGEIADIATVDGILDREVFQALCRVRREVIDAYQAADIAARPRSYSPAFPLWAQPTASRW